jgi:hypothetical protein
MCNFLEIKINGIQREDGSSNSKAVEKMYGS